MSVVACFISVISVK